MSGCGCGSMLTGQFDETYVAREAERREEKGTGKMARRMAEAVADLRSETGGLEEATALDVGAGLGDVLHWLLAGGLGRGIHLEASPAFSRAARELAGVEGVADRMRFLVGDAVELANGAGCPETGATGVPEADLVVLDRVVCCYPAMDALLDATASRARDVYALSAPRSLWPVRAVVWFQNLVRALRKNPFRTFVHAWAEMEERLRSLGFERRWSGGTPAWRIAVYRRVRDEADAAGARPAPTFSPERTSTPSPPAP